MKNELEIKIDDEFAKKVYDEIWAEYKKNCTNKDFCKNYIDGRWTKNNR